MVHHCVAYQDDVGDFPASHAGGAQQLTDQSANLPPNQVLKLLETAGGKTKFNAAHDVRAVSTLAIQRRSHGEYLAVLEVQQLGGDCRGAHIHGNTEPSSRLKFERSFVREDGSVPLAKFDYQVTLDRALAGETPPVCQFIWRKSLSLGVVNLDIALQHLNATSATPALSAARKLHTLLKERVT
jgi:hypothetical protein